MYPNQCPSSSSMLVYQKEFQRQTNVLVYQKELQRRTKRNDLQKPYPVNDHNHRLVFPKLALTLANIMIQSGQQLKERYLAA